MKTTYLFFSSFLLLTLGLNFTDLNRKSPFKKESLNRKYYFIATSYNGTWLNSRNVSDKVYFITSTDYFDCEYVTECSEERARIKRDFLNTLTSSYLAINPGYTPEYFSDSDEAEIRRENAISFYKRLGYKIIEI